MPLLDNLIRGLHRLGHSKTGHDDREATTAEGGDGDGFFHFGELGCAGGGGEDAHVVELVQE